MTFADFISKIDFYTGNRNWFTTSSLTLSQREIVESIHTGINRNSVIWKGRQGGVTTILTLYSLWMAINTPGISICFLVNKQDSHYREVLKTVLDRNLTKFGKHLSLKIDKKHKTELANGSTIHYVNGNHQGALRGYMFDILILEDFFENHYSIANPHEEIIQECMYAINQINGKIIISTTKDTDNLGWFQPYGFQKVYGHFFNGKREVLIEKSGTKNLELQLFD